VAQNRTQDVQVNVRMTKAQRDRLDAARAKLVTGVKVPLGPWMLSLALAEADKVLGPAKK
jgi:hypothetical protein